ncbi:FAD-dependent monooxygenase [Candidatus Nephthysia bennettiae]|uniref:FAD-dependent monooxygenase n=1 Tax=Candidatus Nephthysia bennettiae TaxID=3127016 RepID=A0A934K6Q1_9BACT|nr:FAD-dependent monooxygenase [Candidatus Dormibacteraeota bacterium]MBJ7613252.1 FAD-dependent monooxygenase [Candidatus Dormibacteraeota bacterium]
MAKQVADRGAPLRNDLIQRWDGKVLNRGTIDLQRRFGTPGFCVRRADLMAALRDALGEDAIRTGARVTGVEVTGDGAAALVEGGDRVEGSLLVGADGLHSVVRQQLLGDSPRHLGAIAWRGLADLRLSGGGLAVGRGAHAGWHPVGGDQTYWFCCINAAPGDSRVGDVRTELLEVFGRWWDPVPSLIQATSSREILRHDLYDRPPVWASAAAAATLLGDAAHPMSPGAGQGACLALEDAVVLATCLMRRPGPVVALRTYEGERIERARRMQQASLTALRVLQPRSRLGELGRDLLLRIPPGLVAGRQSWMFEFRAGGWPRSRLPRSRR